MRHASLFLLALLAAPLMAGEVAGKWAVTATDPDGLVHRSEMVLQQEGAELKGEVRMGPRSVQLRDVAFQSDELSFKMPWQDATLTAKMKLAGDELKGQITTPEGDAIAVSAKRTEGAVSSAPASASGKWKLTAITASGREMKVDLELKQDGSRWSGTVTTPDGDVVPVADVVVDGAQVSFKVPTGNGAYAIKLAQAGDGLKGTYTSPDGASGNVIASR